MSTPLAAWVAASVALHTLVAAGAWQADRLARAHASPAAFRRNAAQEALSWVVRAAFFIGVPYAALIDGIATPAQFALRTPDSTLAIALLPVLGGFMLAGALLIGLHARLVVPRYPPQVLPAVRGRARLVQPWGISFILLDALCLQAHWSFYRAGTAPVLPELAMWTGAAVVLAEWLLNPGWLAGWRAPGIWEDQVIVLALMLFSATIAAFGADFWLSLCAHLVLWIGWLALLHLLHRPRTTHIDVQPS